MKKAIVQTVEKFEEQMSLSDNDEIGEDLEEKACPPVILHYSLIEYQSDPQSIEKSVIGMVAWNNENVFGFIASGYEHNSWLKEQVDSWKKLTAKQMAYFAIRKQAPIFLSRPVIVVGDLATELKRLTQKHLSQGEGYAIWSNSSN